MVGFADVVVEKGKKSGSSPAVASSVLVCLPPVAGERESPTNFDSLQANFFLLMFELESRALFC